VNTQIRPWICTNQTKTSPNSSKCMLCPWICHISIKLVPTSIWGVNGDDVAVNLTDELPCQMPHKQGLNWSILTKNFKDKIDWFQKILCNIASVNFYLLSNRSLNYIKKPSNKSLNYINIYPIWSLRHIFAEQSKMTEHTPSSLKILLNKSSVFSLKYYIGKSNPTMGH